MSTTRTVGSQRTHQATLEEFDDVGRCSAIAVDTTARCRKAPVPGSEYCHLHLDLTEYARTG